jgi:hypothetical protein
MRSFVIAVTVALASLAMADVQTFRNNDCGNKIEPTVGTKHGYCYNLQSGVQSAKGCSVGHNLRVYSTVDCDEAGGFYTTVKPQKCVNLGGGEIYSIKCLP